MLDRSKVQRLPNLILSDQPGGQIGKCDNFYLLPARTTEWFLNAGDFLNNVRGKNI